MNHKNWIVTCRARPEPQNRCWGMRRAERPHCHRLMENVTALCYPVQCWRSTDRRSLTAAVHANRCLECFLSTHTGQWHTQHTTRAPIVAMWADRFSRNCWRRFSRFLTCPLTLPPVSASLVYHLCSTPSLLPSCRRGKGEGVGTLS